MKNGVLYKSLENIRYYLDKRKKRQGVGVFILLFFSSLIDVVGLAAIIPVIQIANSPETIHENGYLNSLYTNLGFTTDNGFLLFVVCCVFVFFLIKNLFIVIVSYLQMRFVANVTADIMKKQFAKFFELSYWKFNDIGSATVINHVNMNSTMFGSYILNSIFMLFAELLIIALILTGVAAYEPALFLILAIALGPTTFLIYSGLKKRNQEAGQKVDELRPPAYRLLYDSFMGYIDLKLTHNEQRFQDKFIAIKEKSLYYDALRNLYNVIPSKAIETIALFGVIIIFLYSLFLAGDTAGILTLLGLFVAASYRLMPSINRILASMMNLKAHQYVLDNLALHREETAEKYQINANQQPLPFDDEITFDHVGFTFKDSDKPTLKEISFSVKKGEKVGFVGTSGSGKTTLMNVFLRFFNEDEGSIKVDGVPLTERNILAWREKVGYVRQDVFVLNGTLRENITLCEDHPDEERLRKAVQNASLKEFVETLPQGFDTYVGEKGSKLSGGQRQRLGIARAMYHDAEILVFDEATSALDNETEKEVTEAIKRLAYTDFTLFIIAHRITTLKECDRIYELDQGRIIREHQYEELIKSVV